MASLGELLRGLKDFKFQTLITPQIVGLALFLAVALAVLEYVVNTIDAFSTSSGFGLFYLLILGPLYILYMTISYRVMLEIAVVLFRILAMRKERAAILREVATRG